MTSKKLLYNPTLETLLMVEDFIRRHSGEFTKYQIWKRLPRKTMYQTYCVISDYLLGSGKIMTDKVGKVGWVYNPELVRKYLRREDLTWKPKEHEEKPKRWKAKERKK